MAYADDKRIFELTQAFSNFLSSSFAADKDGNIAAVRFTGQQILDFIQSNPVFQIASAGNTNPDNAFGDNGGLYFRVPDNGSAIQLFQKINDVWVSVFNLPLSYKSEFLSADLDDTTYPDAIVLPVTLTEKQTFSGMIKVNYYSDGTYTTITRYEILTPTYDTDLGLLSGFSEKTDYMKIFVPII